MARMSCETSTSIPLAKKKSTLCTLSDCMSYLATLPHTESIPLLANLLPDATSSLSTTGERLLQHEAYRGTGSINTLAWIWMRTGTACRQKNAPLRLRLQQNELFEHFEHLYKNMQREIETSKVAWFFACFREFTLGCQHCLGPPWYAIPRGERVGGALYFGEVRFVEIWGDAEGMGSLFGPAGNGTRDYGSWRKASREMIEEALARGFV